MPRPASHQGIDPPHRSWRRPLRTWHRDLGYLCAALTVAYGISGIAVNHRGDWDYNRASATTRFALGGPAGLLPEVDAARRAVLLRDPESLTSDEEDLLARVLGRRLGAVEPPHNTYWRSRQVLVVHLSPGDADLVAYDVRTGVLERTQRTERPVLRQLNFLHLNEAGRWWTYVADAYAAALVFLALSGLVMVRGRRGLWGRGGVLVGIGLLVPTVALVWLGLG